MFPRSRIPVWWQCSVHGTCGGEAVVVARRGLRVNPVVTHSQPAIGPFVSSRSARDWRGVIDHALLSDNSSPVPHGPGGKEGPDRKLTWPLKQSILNLGVPLLNGCVAYSRIYLWRHVSSTGERIGTSQLANQETLNNVVKPRIPGVV